MIECLSEDISKRLQSRIRFPKSPFAIDAARPKCYVGQAKQRKDERSGWLSNPGHRSPIRSNFARFAFHSSRNYDLDKTCNKTHRLGRDGHSGHMTYDQEIPGLAMILRGSLFVYQIILDSSTRLQYFLQKGLGYLK